MNFFREWDITEIRNSKYNKEGERHKRWGMLRDGLKDEEGVSGKEGKEGKGMERE